MLDEKPELKEHCRAVSSRPAVLLNRWGEDMVRVFVAGGASYNMLIFLDALPQPHPHTIFSRHFHETVGSTGAGKALNLAALGLDVTFHALIGDDPAGHAIADRMAAASVNFIGEFDPAGTHRHVNLMDDTGRRISIHINTGTFEPEIDLIQLEPLIAQSDIVSLSIINYCRRLIPLIKRHNKPIWCDVHDYDGANPYHRDFIEAADVLQMSSDAMPDFRPFMAQQIASGKQLVICTHGRDGATALTADGRWIETPAITSYERRDTNGAGDSFFAGVLYGHLQGYPLERCLRLGSVISGLCITSLELAYPGLSAALAEAEYARHYPDTA